MGKGGIVFYFWGADATEKGSLGPNTVVNSNQKGPLWVSDVPGLVLGPSFGLLGSQIKLRCLFLHSFRTGVIQSQP